MSGQAPGGLDVYGILEALVSAQVDFVLVGGIAVAHHGFVRATKDVDIVPNPADLELEKLWSALRELEARPFALGDFRPEEIPPLSLKSLTGGANWDLATRYGRLDILQYVEGALESEEDFARLRGRAVPEQHRFGTVWVVAYEDLIDLKNVAGRDQDLIDIRALREANRDSTP